MAKYAQGFERKNSDTKNLIILISAIVAVVVIAVVIAVFYNKFIKKEAQTFASEKYAEYYLTDYSKLLDQRDDEGNYFIYVCSKTNTADKNMQLVLEYIDKCAESDNYLKLYLLDYDGFDSTSDETETANKTAVDNELGYTVQAGCLIQVKDNALTNTSSQVIKDTTKVKDKIKELIK